MCDRCTTGFRDLDELMRHKQSHETGTIDDMVPRPDDLHIDRQVPRVGLNDVMAPMPSIRLDESSEDARSERDVTEGERNDLSNEESNRSEPPDFRGDTEWQVNPDQTPRQTKTVRPIDSV